MSRHRKIAPEESHNDNAEVPIVDGPEEVAPEVETATQPVPIVELEDVIQAESLSPEQHQQGVRFFFGEIGLLTFPDKTTYHVRGHNAFITDPVLIENIKAHAESHPTSKIFIQ